MGAFEKFIIETNSSTSASEVFAHFQKALQEMGFDRVIYSLITDHPSLKKQSGHGIQLNYPEDWMKHYAKNGYEKKDPVPKHAFVSAKPFTWDWLVKSRELTTDETMVMNEAREAKLLDGVGIPLYGPNGEIAGVGLASSAGGIQPDKNMLSLLHALSFQFHLAYCEHDISAEEAARIAFTAREKEILLWAAEGKSDMVIADLLNISYDTVRFHMKNIFRKLDANERTFAVVKALRHGLIMPSFVYPTKVGS